MFFFSSQKGSCRVAYGFPTADSLEKTANGGEHPMSKLRGWPFSHRKRETSTTLVGLKSRIPTRTKNEQETLGGWIMTGCMGLEHLPTFYLPMKFEYLPTFYLPMTWKFPYKSSKSTSRSIPSLVPMDPWNGDNSTTRWLDFLGEPKWLEMLQLGEILVVGLSCS